MSEVGDPQTVFYKLVEKILYEPGFAPAVLHGSEQARKEKLDKFVEQEYPELIKKPKALKAKQKAVLDSFNQVLAKTNFARIENLRGNVNKKPYTALPL